MADDIPDTGAVFTFGKSHFADNEPSHFFIKNDPIVAISCGDEHSAVICQNGRVFVFGGNAWGQLGLGHKDEVSRPSCVKWLKPHRALFVACGRAHTVFVTDTHAIYTVGCNEEGQLGTGDTEAHTVPQYVEVEGCEELKVRQVSAGSNHTAILTETGRVFVCGSNTEGQLGLGEDTRSCLKFTELTFMERISFVECGYYHTVFITSKGAVFVTGDNEGKKLGVSEAGVNVYSPVVLPTETAIKSVCCGAAHTFLLSMDESKVLALGCNERGQLALPHSAQWLTEPTELEIDKMFDGNQLKLVACGAMHTAFVTDNGLLYTCGESRHNKLCLNEIDNAGPDDADPNQYLPKRVTAMNGFIVDNVACGGCHTLLSATKEAESLMTNAERGEEPALAPAPTALVDLPPLKLPAAAAATTPLPSAPDDTGSIDSLEANVSGSHIVNINDLDNDNNSTHGLEELNKDDTDPLAPIDKLELKEIIDTMENLADKTAQSVEVGIDKVKDEMKGKMEAVEDIIEKAAVDVDPCKHCDERKILDVPDEIITEIANSPPPKSPILQELLRVPDLTQLSDVSKTSDDGQRSESGSKSENETIPCGSDKSSPQGVKSAKTQAVMPIVRSEDAAEATELASEAHEDSEVVVNKLEQGRFGRFFQSIRDKENSCMGKGKVIEEKVEESVTKGIAETEKTIHKVEETIETEIRNQTNSRTCTIL